MPVDVRGRLKGHVRETSEIDYDTFIFQVAWHMFRYSTIGGASFVALLVLVASRNVWEAVLFGGLVGLALGGIIAAITFYHRALQYNEYVVNYEEWQMADDPPRTVPRPSHGDEVVVERRPKTVRHDGQEWEFSGAELDKMLRSHEQGKANLTRNLLGYSGPDYDTMTDIMVGKEYLEKKGRMYFWTDRGAVWLQQE